jgi:RimJ/RimL family protein N-acetyltransferase
VVERAPTPRLQTQRFGLVPLTPENAEEMADVLSDLRLYAFIGGRPPSAQELRDRYTGWVRGSGRSDEAWHNWVIRLLEDGRAIGHAQATVAESGLHADIAWVVGSSWQGRGFATEAARELVRWLEATGVKTITAHIHPNHAASARVAEHAGLIATAEMEDGERVWRRDVDPRRAGRTARAAGRGDGSC